MHLNKKFLLISIFTLIIIFFSQNALAGRVGGGKNYGSKRSFLKSNSSQQYRAEPKRTLQNNNTTTNTNTQPQQNNKNGSIGIGKAALLGAMAGATGGYLAGKHIDTNTESENNNSTIINDSTQQAIVDSPQQPQVNVSQNRQINSSNNLDNIPWNIIGILGILLFIGLIFFKRRSDTYNNKNPDNGFNDQLYSQHQNTSTKSFNIPSIKRTDGISAIDNEKLLNLVNQSQLNNGQNSFQHERMADGVEVVYFIRQIKGMFLHIQSMNNVENIDEIAKYMTPEFYNEIKHEIINNKSLADFSDLNCELLNSETVGQTLVASVKFSGMVSEDVGQQMKPFSEVWNFVKTDLNFGKWLVNGIQQASV